MRYLITGGAGMLGAWTCRALLDSGDEPVALDQRLGQALTTALGETTARTIWEEADATDGMALAQVAKTRAVDGIIHLASLLAQQSSAVPGTAVRVNCISMVNALETARLLGIPRVVWASSAAVHAGYMNGELIPNDAAYRPTNIYGATKILNEQLAEHYGRTYGIAVTGIRFTLMTGIGKTEGISGAISTELIEKPARGLAGRVPYGDDTANWLWVGDAARALVLATRSDLPGPRNYNITGETRSIRDAADVMRRIVPGADITLLPGTAGLYHNIDASEIQKDLGYRSEVMMEEQLKRLVEQARTSP